MPNHAHKRLKRAHHENSAPDVREKKSHNSLCSLTAPSTLQLRKPNPRSSLDFPAFNNFSPSSLGCPTGAFTLNSALELKHKSFEKQKRGGARLRRPEVALSANSLKWKKSRFWSRKSARRILNNGILKRARRTRATAGGACSGEDLQERPFESAKSWKCFDQDSPAPEMWSNATSTRVQGSFTQLLSGSNKRYLYSASKHVACLHCHLQL